MPTQNFRVGEMLNKRTRNSKTWINFDGSYTTEIYPYDIHYQDENGNWHNINTDLYDEADLDQIDFPVAKEGADVFRVMKDAAQRMKKKNILDRDMTDYQGLKVPFDCRIPKNFKRGYTIGKGSTKLRFIPVGASPAKGYLEEGKKNCVHYQDAWNDTDVCLEVMPNGVKETIILKSDRAPFSFSFEVDGPLEDDLTAGNLKLQPAWLQDANGEKRDVSQTVRREGDKTFVDLEADVTGLTYPIEIDPTVTASSAGAEAYISSNNPNGRTYNSGSAMSGYDYTGTESRAYFRYDTSSIPSDAIITNSSFSITYTSQYEGSGAVHEVHYLGSGVDPSTVTWNNMASSYNNKVGSFSSAGTSANTRITIPLTLPSKVGSYTAIGVKRSAVPAQYPKYIFILGYSGVSTSDYPTLTITYNRLPTAPTVTSPNGGETWNAQHTITWNPSTDAETAQGSLRYQIQLTTDNRQTWKDIVPLTPPGATSFEYDFTNEPETSLAKIRIRAYDGTSYGPWDESDGVFTIQHNVAPTVPTNLSPSGGTPKDRGSVIRLSWQHNDANGDPQAQFDLQWRKQGDTTWNDVSQVTTNQYWDAPAGTFPKGTIEWRVRTYDQAWLSSPYSDIQAFFAGDKPANPTIIDPANGAIVPVANPTVQWSSVGQTAYHVKVLDGNDNLLWELQANSTNKAQTVLYDLQNNTDYKIQVAIKNADNLWSDFVTSNIHVSYTPPAVPIVTTTKGEGIIIVSIDNPTPTGTEPNVSYNDLYRRKQGETTWTRIATNIPADASFIDYTPASGQVYEYFVRAWGDNGTYSDSSVVSKSISLTGVWLHEADNPLETLHQFKLVSDRSENWQPTAAMMQFAGRRLPIAEYDDTEQRSVSVKITVLKNSDDREAIERLIRSKNTLCYRDARGRKMFCHAFQLPVDDETYGNTVSLTFEEVSYTEEV
ncbi:DNRLRE domain-containing protein [Parageobacillus sp. VR-IP]|uniref:DNRLRE domain-containing protein n=1 Tax=Parageobacillus sp. VR-IP TaxID=2742205 RepID=UPI00158329EA|nr:DNRLRE domain-containing protein [Parageobacillus sp. VR-IP]NUK30990.1 DNRLRE domain-containing protein [Parageobacillus sp. VR-IP]